MDLRGKKALVVDDDDMHVVILCHTLERVVGCEVITANSGQEAQKILETNPNQVDVIFSDIVMPNGDGWDLITFVRNHPDLANIPVIATSASCGKRDKEEALAAGYDGFMSKPLTPREFEGQLNDMLSEF